MNVAQKLHVTCPGKSPPANPATSGVVQKVAQTCSKSCPGRLDLTKFRPTIVEHEPEFGQNWPLFGRIWPTLAKTGEKAKVGPNLAKFDHHPPSLVDLGQSRQKMATLGRNWANTRLAGQQVLRNLLNTSGARRGRLFEAKPWRWGCLEPARCCAPPLRRSRRIQEEPLTDMGDDYMISCSGHGVWEGYLSGDTSTQTCFPTCLTCLRCLAF